MGYKGLPQESLSSAQRLIGPPGADPADTRKMLESLKGFAAYGLLLIPDTTHPLAKLVAARWDELNHMTGGRFLLLAFQPPETFSKDFEDSWRKELGDQFAPVWDKWNTDKASSADTYDYGRMFDGQVIKRTDMPCLALFTDPQANRAAVLSLPDWEGDELWTFLKSICDTIDSCADEPDADRRLQALESALTSLPARASRTLGHLTGKAASYVVAHPVKIVVLALNFAVAAATANFIPIGAAGIGFMKDVLGFLKA